MSIIVTGGAKGADIDVFACVIAYVELLTLEDKDSVPVIAGRFTASVTPSILDWGARYKTNYKQNSQDRFVLVDISDPDYIPSFVNHEYIDEVYDHRQGHENYWKEKLGNDSHIELVGSCGTLIWEEFKQREKRNNISKHSAKLLLASIVSNTLNFQAPITTNRDKNAHEELSEITRLGDEWITNYFLEQERSLLGDFENYLHTDTKIFKVKNNDFAIGQLELWNPDIIIENRKEEMAKVMKEYQDIPWFINLPNISKGYNYIFSRSEVGKKAVEKTLGVRFEGDVAKTEELIMRKQIMADLRENWSANRF